jgi:hypothetical protein
MSLLSEERVSARDPAMTLSMAMDDELSDDAVRVGVLLVNWQRTCWRDAPATAKRIGSVLGWPPTRALHALRELARLMHRDDRF